MKGYVQTFNWYCMSQNTPHILTPLNYFTMFLALLMYSRGNIKQLGRLNQPELNSTAHRTVLFSTSESLTTFETKSPTNQNHSAQVIAMMAWYALSFDLSTFFFASPPSPGPERTRTQRTEILQKDMINMEENKKHNNGAIVLQGMQRNATPVSPKHSSQTHRMLMFLILTPRVFFRFR